MQSLLEHMHHEEDELLPQLKATEGVTPEYLMQLGRVFESAKLICPTRCAQQHPQGSAAQQALCCKAVLLVGTVQGSAADEWHPTSCIATAASWHGQGWCALASCIAQQAVQQCILQHAQCLSDTCLSHTAPANKLLMCCRCCRPHAWAPLKPPLNVAFGAAITPVDFMRDMIQFEGAPPL